MHTSIAALSVLLALAKSSLSITNQPKDGISINSKDAVPPFGPVIYAPPIGQTSKRQNFDNTCGTQNGKAVRCDPNSPGGGQCCSSYGFCGNGPLYCDDGCQPDFGKCGLNAASVRQRHCGPKHKNQKCSPGECCSANGKCGRSQAFCGKHCQPEFGTCHKDDHAPKPTPEQKPVPVDRPNRCGKNFGNNKCVAGECCSAAGYCGKGSLFCMVPQECQRTFGVCDSDATPKGFDVSPLAQPRPQVGKTPYGQEIKKCIKPKTAALTFDDGPSNNTQAILNLLKQHNAKATFFLSGNTNGKGMIDEEKAWIHTIRRIIDDGHQIGSHTWSHPHMSAIPQSARLLDMFRNDRAIANIVGKFPTYMRPPYIECSKECLQDMTSIGYHVVGWDVDSHDWETTTTFEQMKQHVDHALYDRPLEGNILLIQHDHNEHAVELARYTLEQIKNREWQAVTLGECLNDPEANWYHEPAWVQPSSMASSDGTLTGCVVSTPGFCGFLSLFQDKQQCNKAHNSCQNRHRGCNIVLGIKNPTCIQYGRICAHHKSFCKSCGGKDQPQCKFAEWSFNRLT